MSDLAIALLEKLREVDASGQSWADWSFNARFTSEAVVIAAAQIIAGNY